MRILMHSTMWRNEIDYQVCEAKRWHAIAPSASQLIRSFSTRQRFRSWIHFKALPHDYFHHRLFRGESPPVRSAGADMITIKDMQGDLSIANRQADPQAQRGSTRSDWLSHTLYTRIRSCIGFVGHRERGGHCGYQHMEFRRRTSSAGIWTDPYFLWKDGHRHRSEPRSCCGHQQKNLKPSGRNWLNLTHGKIISNEIWFHKR